MPFDPPPDASPDASLGGDLVESLEAVAVLAPAWEALMARAGATPFQSPGCILSWARHHAPDRLAAAVVRQGGRLVALVPVFSWQGAVLLAGTGPTDYNDGVIEAGRADIAAQALEQVARLAARRSCPLIDLQQLRPSSLLLAAAAPQDWESDVGPGDACPIAPVQGHDGLGAMPAKWRRKLDYSRRKAARAGGYSVAVADAAAVPALLADLVALHRRRWAAAGQAGVLDDPLTSAFLADALPALQSEGRLRLWSLSFAGEVGAVICSLQDGRAAYLYLQGVDPERSALGLGSLLLAHVIEAAALEGVRSLHFLRGEEPYKANWGAVAAPTWRRTLRLL